MHAIMPIHPHRNVQKADPHFAACKLWESLRRNWPFSVIIQDMSVNHTHTYTRTRTHTPVLSCWYYYNSHTTHTHKPIFIHITINSGRRIHSYMYTVGLPLSLRFWWQSNTLKMEPLNWTLRMRVHVCMYMNKTLMNWVQYHITTLNMYISVSNKKTLANHRNFSNNTLALRKKIHGRYTLH